MYLSKRGAAKEIYHAYALPKRIESKTPELELSVGAGDTPSAIQLMTMPMMSVGEMRVGMR